MILDVKARDDERERETGKPPHVRMDLRGVEKVVWSSGLISGETMPANPGSWGVMTWR